MNFNIFKLSFSNIRINHLFSFWKRESDKSFSMKNIKNCDVSNNYIKTRRVLISKVNNSKISNNSFE